MSSSAATIHARIGATDSCACGAAWPCARAGYLTDEGMRRLRTRLDPLGHSVSLCNCSEVHPHV